MPEKINVLAISGSTRTASSNLQLITAVALSAHADFNISLYEGLATLPHFNPDLDGEHAPPEVQELRRSIRDADAVLICTPEYALGVPGTLKNAIDWTVSDATFSQKPVALITAASSGARAHQSLLGTLLILESRMTGSTQLLISFVKTKVTNDGRITDQVTLEGVSRLIRSLTELVRYSKGDELSDPLLLNEGINSGSS